MRKLTISLTNEWREVYEDGTVKRFVNGQQPYIGSKEWVVTGAVVLNNFGNVSYTLSLKELMDKLSGPDKASLFYKNGKPKFRVTDIDHGTNRIWGEVANYTHRWIVLDK